MEDGITEVEDENKSNEEGEDKDDECTGNSSALFLTAAAQNLLCLKLAEKLGVVIANPWVSWLKKFQEITFQWIKREENKPADRLTKSLLPNMSAFFFFHFYVPTVLTNLLHDDYVLSRSA
ncbi:hypothetical protein Bca101_064747 [Brassica carinata]